ncbi:MAG: hypothetical protein NW207_05420 [Cytophagales bacterium]|nr:hypothetical protein [Cytophagales bacterium]
MKIVILHLVILTFISVAQPQSVNTLYYFQYYPTLQSFAPETNDNKLPLYLYIKDIYEAQKLLPVKIPNKCTAVFINGKYIANAKKIHTIDIQMLTNSGVNNNKSFLIHFYPKEPNLYLNDNKYFSEKILNPIKNISIIKILKNNYITGMLLFFISLMTFKSWVAYFPSFSLSLFVREQDIKSKSLESGAVNILVYSILSVFFAFIVLYLNRINLQLFHYFDIIMPFNMKTIILNALLLVLLFTLLKLMSNWLWALIFNVWHVARFVSFDFVMYFCILLGILSFISIILTFPQFNFPALEPAHIIYSLGLLSALIFIKQLINFFNTFQFRKNYLIAYIAVTELFTSVFLLKFLLKLA